MSYNSCKFGFTNDQKSRMRDAISNQRDSYLYSNGNNSLIPPSSSHEAADTL